MKRVIENFFIFLVWISLQAQSYAVEIDIDTSNVPHLVAFADKAKQVLVPWHFLVNAELSSPNYTPPNNIRIRFDSNYNGVAYISKKSEIIGSVNHYTKNDDDIGSLVACMSYIIQSPKDCPPWLDAGIADWIRYYNYEPFKKMPSKPRSSNSYKMGNVKAAYFLQYIIDNSAKKEDRHIVYWANRNCREGTYDDSMWVTMTGKCLDQHWDDMIKSEVAVPKYSTQFGCYKGYCRSWCWPPQFGNWCYTTRGLKDDKGWIECDSANDCNENWQCANECHPKDYT